MLEVYEQNSMAKSIFTSELIDSNFNVSDGFLTFNSIKYENVAQKFILDKNEVISPDIKDLFQLDDLVSSKFNGLYHGKMEFLDKSVPVNVLLYKVN